MLKDKCGIRRPDDYVQVQRDYNEVHLNGKSVFQERACQDAAQLSQLVKAARWTQGSFLDVGCRMGYAMEVFQEHFPLARVEGVDLVPEFVEQADKVGDAIVGDIHALPYYDGEFDWVFCTQVLEHAYDPTLALSELFRVAKQGLYLAVPAGETDESFEYNKSHLWKSDGMLDWLELMVPHRKYGWDLFYAKYDEPSCSLYAILLKEPSNE